MDLQYLSDTQGRHTAVVIPIEDWKNLTTKYQDLKDLESPYKPEFVAKVQKSRQEYKDGNFVRVEKENFKAFLGIE